MPHCERVEKRPFFNDKMANMPAIATGPTLTGESVRGKA